MDGNQKEIIHKNETTITGIREYFRAFLYQVRSLKNFMLNDIKNYEDYKKYREMLNNYFYDLETNFINISSALDQYEYKYANCKNQQDYTITKLNEIENNFNISKLK